MENNLFDQQEEFKKILEEARKLRTLTFSDIIDGNGHQYVDLVQEGGGVLGVALVGYTYVLEEANIRFYSLAGTSAGAINTIILAAVGSIDETKSKKILDYLLKQDLFEFVDGNPKLKKLIQQGIEGTPLKKLLFKILLSISPLKKALFKDLGINPGNKFKDWIDTILKESGEDVTTIQKFMDYRSKGCLPDGLKHRKGDSIKEMEIQTHIITADITTQSKVQFPKMAHLYWSDLNAKSPAEMVRASMSVPMFFTPYQIDNLPGNGSPATKDWNDLADYRGTIPESAKFVDGGMISNFPINVFHRETGLPPRKPTFGVKLSAYRESYSKVDNIWDFLGSMVSTMRHDADIQFLVKNPEFKKLICFIDANKEFKWLNFQMSPERQSELFLLGARKGLEFLKNFNWEAYKKLR